MTIERTDREIIIKLPADLNVDDIQRMVDYLSYRQAIQRSQATQAQIDDLVNEVKKRWWEKNKGRFPGLNADSNENLV
ncbi:MAG: hypothetical protein IPN33_05565 [Saprospiraceae bacterium]|nr:hypothetical protein [Saprospiraceae bacterium]